MSVGVAGASTLVVSACVQLLMAPPPAGPFGFVALARGSGLVSYLALAVAMLSGLLVGQRAQSGARRVLYAAHEHATVAALVVGAIHATAVVALMVVPRGAAVPMSPLAATLGAMGLVGVLGLAGSKWLLARLSTAMWRRLHRLSVIVFGVAVGHVLLAGPGMVEPGTRWLYTAAGAIVAGAVLFRVLGRFWLTPSAEEAPEARAPAGLVEGAPARLSAAALHELLERAVGAARSRGEPLALLCVSIDCAEVGASARRDAHAGAARQLRTAAGRRAEVWDLEAESQFAVLLRGRNAAAYEPFAQRLVDALGAAAEPETRKVSVGACCFPLEAWAADSLASGAQMALRLAQLEAASCWRSLGGHRDHRDRGRAVA